MSIHSKSLIREDPLNKTKQKHFRGDWMNNLQNGPIRFLHYLWSQFGDSTLLPIGSILLLSQLNPAHFYQPFALKGFWLVRLYSDQLETVPIGAFQVGCRRCFTDYWEINSIFLYLKDKTALMSCNVNFSIGADNYVAWLKCQLLSNVISLEGSKYNYNAIFPCLSLNF